MKYTCTLNALLFIRDLQEELDHLRHDDMDVTPYILSYNSLIAMAHEIRREYARLHPDQPLPSTTIVSQPKDHP